MSISVDAETMGVFLQIYCIFANEDNRSLLMEKLYLKSKFNSRTDVGGFMEYNFHNLETLFGNLPECSSVIQVKNANLRNLTDKFTIRYEFAVSLIEWLLHHTKHESVGIVTGFNSGITLKTKISGFLESHQYDFCESQYAEGTLIVKLRHPVEKILEDKPIDEALDVKPETKDSVHKKRHKKRNKKVAQEERLDVQARVEREIAQQFNPQVTQEFNQQVEQENNQSNFQWIWENLNKVFAWRPVDLLIYFFSSRIFLYSKKAS